MNHRSVILAGAASMVALVATLLLIVVAFNGTRQRTVAREALLAVCERVNGTRAITNRDAFGLYVALTDPALTTPRRAHAAALLVWQPLTPSCRAAVDRPATIAVQPVIRFAHRLPPAAALAVPNH